MANSFKDGPAAAVNVPPLVPDSARKDSGFTLIELIVTIAVAAVIITIAIPSYADMVRNNRLTAQANELLSALTYARSEAIRLRQNVSVCAADGENCSESPQWESGWLVFADANGDGQRQSGETLLRSWSPVAGAITVRPSLTDLATLSFNARGAANASLTFVLCDPRGATHARGITLMQTGRARAAAHEGAGSADVVDTIHGDDVTCG